MAVEVQVSVETIESDAAQMESLGFVFKDGTDIQKMECIRGWMEGMIVQSDVTLMRAPLSIKVLSTVPNNTPVLVSMGARLTIKMQADSVHDLTTSIQQLSISSKPTGLEKAYDKLYEMVSYPLIYKDWIDQLQVECPKGVLLYGPPGVGKTFLVSSVAKACGADMFVIQGPEIYGPYIGESEAILRQKFNEAKTAALDDAKPVLLFIDEIDALTPHRDRAQSHENRVVAQLLTLMDGIESRGRLIVVGATNRPNAIDPALRRPGRFDREISMEAPDVITREMLFRTQLKNMPLDDTVTVDLLASSTNGYVAADIGAVCREAAMHAVQRFSRQGSMASLKIGLDDFKTALGVVRPSMQRGFQVQVEKTGWHDVGGLDDVKKQLKQAVEWPLVYKDSFIRLGLKPPRGILLYGPPGCSKTTLVKVIASSSGAAFLSINGAQLYSPYVGDSEKIIRTTFQKARASAPSIIFLDEIEAIVGKRNMGNGGSGSGDSVQERVLSTLLNEMDGVETAESVLVVGATNRPDMLDAALLRPGRFDRLVYVPPPDIAAREEILRIHTRNTKLSDDVDLKSIAQRTSMYTGADLQNMCREAAMMALRELRVAEQVKMRHFEQALSTIPPSISQSTLIMYSKMQKDYGFAQ
ncbi:P-loop containing nucleoside triphosphate hydrolase protein [Dichotomocladium elegans]|nr:P-loop containing nucleoside triphosphate hydrolase protein [Dichotomocladium elegans]